MTEGRTVRNSKRGTLFYDEVDLNKSTLVFKRLKGSCPAYMYDLLKFNADLHT